MHNDSIAFISSNRNQIEYLTTTNSLTVNTDHDQEQNWFASYVIGRDSQTVDAVVTYKTRSRISNVNARVKP